MTILRCYLKCSDVVRLGDGYSRLVSDAVVVVYVVRVCFVCVLGGDF